MKKIITVVAAICVAMSSFADAITCARAVELTNALADGATSTEEYTVHGFITYTDGNVSSKNGSPYQQVFWMADEEGTDKVFQAYWANLPEPYQTNVEPLPVGTELNMTGKLTKYVKNGNVTPEMANGTIQIIKVPTIERDTFDVTADEAIAEASTWSVGDISTDYYRVAGKVKAIVEPYEANTGVPGFNGKSTFTLEVTNTDDIVFKAYRCYLVEEVFAGDSVVILGPLQLYEEKTVEISGGKVTITKKDHPEPQTITVTKDKAIEIATAQAEGWISLDNYIVENVVVDSISYKYSETNKTQSFYAFGKDRVADFIAYSCTVPSELKVGNIVTVRGKLQNFKGNAEISKGTVTIINNINNVASERAAVKKVIRNGQLYIQRGDELFNAQGARVE